VVLSITLTDAQAALVAKLDPMRSADAIIQIHVDTWLAPLLSDAIRSEAVQVSTAYARADDAKRADVKRSLNVDRLAVEADAVKR